MSQKADRLYELLPAIYRRRDAEQAPFALPVLVRAVMPGIVATTTTWQKCISRSFAVIQLFRKSGPS